MNKIALMFALLLMGCTTVRTEWVAGMDNGWGVGKYRNCTLDPAGEAVLNCAAPDDATAYPTRVIYKGRRAELGKPTQWECLLKKSVPYPKLGRISCEPVR